MSVKNNEVIKPQNIEERVIWYTLLGTYGFYVIGAQPIFLPVIAWFLVLCLGCKLWEQRTNNAVDRKVIIPFTVWVWIFSMLIILLCVAVSHIDFNLGGARFIKSLLRWSREYAFWALFPLIGGCLNIRPQLLYRAVCILCLQSLIVIPICYLAFFLDLPEGSIYTSPLYLLGGNSAELYNVGLYTFDYNINLVRLSLFSPWSPNLALIAIIYFFLASQESDKKWRLVGMIGAIAMMVTASSRTALLCFPTVILLTWILTNFTRPIIYFTAGVGTFLMSIFATDISYFLENFTQKLYTARADSSKVRMTSLRLSLEMWWNEAPIWGHGFTESQGPIIMNSLPVGTSGCGTLTASILRKSNNASVSCSRVWFQYISPSLLTTMLTFSGFAFKVWLVSDGRLIFCNLRTTGLVIKKMMSNTNMMSTSGVVLISDMT